jgi:hypothetical protein
VRIGEELYTENAVFNADGPCTETVSNHLLLLEIYRNFVAGSSKSLLQSCDRISKRISRAFASSTKVFIRAWAKQYLHWRNKLLFIDDAGD